MDCPVCRNVNLAVSERQGIEIDYCPQCRGVWLDRGELDKIIERWSHANPSDVRNEQREPSFLRRSETSSGYDNPHYGAHHKKRKREGFFSDLFDFD
jgi:Zn-finger nucleic acid-binding protein